MTSLRRQLPLFGFLTELPEDSGQIVAGEIPFEWFVSARSTATIENGGAHAMMREPVSRRSIMEQDIRLSSVTREQYWQDQLKAWKASGLKQMPFCREHQL